MRLNSSISVVAVNESFNSVNGLPLVQCHDIVVDASDNVTSRYLVNDAAVLAGKPLVSGAALSVDGQVKYHYSFFAQRYVTKRVFLPSDLRL